VVSPEYGPVIRLAIPDIDEDDVAAVVDVLRSGWLVQGDHVRQFEAGIGDLVGAKHAVAVSSCTAALQLSLLALGIRQGDRVAVPAYSWPATANVVALSGADPVFIDIEPLSFNMDPQKLEESLRTWSNVKAIVPVHAFGGMADLPRILELGERYGAPVLEDAACALGATLHGRSAGAWGSAGCFSFHPRKSITTGEGGIVATNDADLADRVRSLRNHGIARVPGPPDFVLPGFNYRMTDLQGALGCTQLAKLPRLLARRREMASEYDRLLAGSGLQTHCSIEPASHVHQAYVALLPPGRGAQRQWVLSQLQGRGIEAGIGTHHIPLTSFFRQRFGYAPGDFPVTDDVAARAIALPLHTQVSPEQQAHVVTALLSELNSGSGPHALSR
jgi:perosamine synthetase